MPVKKSFPFAETLSGSPHRKQDGLGSWALCKLAAHMPVAHMPVVNH